MSVDGNVTDSNIIVGNGNQIVINKYSYFQSAPANLRRSFDALIADKIRNFVGRRFVFDALDEFLNKQDSGYFVIRASLGELMVARSMLVMDNRRDRASADLMRAAVASPIPEMETSSTTEA